VKRRPTIRDIARKAGVSDTAVSLAFQKNSRLSEPTRARILRIARELNYFPNRSARTLRYGASRTIGFVVNDITDPFYSRMIRSAEKIALELGYTVLFSESNWDPGKETRVISDMIESRVLGVLMCFCEKTEESLRFIDLAGVPVIAVDTFPKFYHGSYVVNDVENAGFLAADHLLGQGCRAPVFFNSNESMSGFSSFRLLLRGFRKRLRQSGVSGLEPAVVLADLTIEGGVQGFENLLAAKVDFDGIFCVNDLCALGVVEAAEKHGYRTGRDLAVMGIDNLEISAVSRISLTSIDQPYDRIIELATRSLIESIEKKEPCRLRRKLKPSLVVRGSTRLAARRRRPG
jgi:LacI family transcriptional regulator